MPSVACTRIVRPTSIRSFVTSVEAARVEAARVKAARVKPFRVVTTGVVAARV